MTSTIETAPKLSVHTAGELHTPIVADPITFTFNLSKVLSDPAHTLPAHLVELDGTDERVSDFVFATDGALDLFLDIERLINGLLKRGKDVGILILCRGGRHRSVAFGDNLAQIFDVEATHHHKHLPVVRR